MMGNPLKTWVEGLPEREPPYDEFLDRHPRILVALCATCVLLAVLLAVYVIAIVLRIAGLA